MLKLKRGTQSKEEGPRFYFPWCNRTELDSGSIFCRKALKYP